LDESFLMRSGGGVGADVEVALRTGAAVEDILGRLGRGELGRDGGMCGVKFGVVEGGGVVGWVMPWRCTYGIWMDWIDVYLLLLMTA
jgi:hypothetical protein